MSDSLICFGLKSTRLCHTQSNVVEASKVKKQTSGPFSRASKMLSLIYLKLIGIMVSMSGCFPSTGSCWSHGSISQSPSAPYHGLRPSSFNYQISPTLFIWFSWPCDLDQLIFSTQPCFPPYTLQCYMFTLQLSVN